MTTKTITIQKQGTITLPKEWLKKMNQAKKITAYFINGNILLSRMENEKENILTPHMSKGLEQFLEIAEVDIKKEKNLSKGIFSKKELKKYLVSL